MEGFAATPLSLIATAGFASQAGDLIVQSADNASLVLSATALPVAARFGFFAGLVVGILEVTCLTAGCVSETAIAYI